MRQAPLFHEWIVRFHYAIKLLELARKRKNGLGINKLLFNFTILETTSSKDFVSGLLGFEAGIEQVQLAVSHQVAPIILVNSAVLRISEDVVGLGFRKLSLQKVLLDRQWICPSATIGGLRGVNDFPYS